MSVAILRFVLIQNLRNLLDWLVMSSVRASKDDEDADCGLVNVLLDRFAIEAVMALFADWQDRTSTSK